MLAKTTTYKQRYWLKHVKAADLSGGTIADYAATHEVSLKGLYQWKTKLIKLKLYDPSASSPVSDFVPIKLSPSQVSTKHGKPAQINQSGCTVTLTNGNCIEFHGELSAHVIRTIITNMSQVN